MKKIAIFGCSGFASEIIDICDALGFDRVIMLSEKESEKNAVNGIEIVTEKYCHELAQQGFKFAIGIANSAVKKKIYSKYANFDFINLIHPTASFGRNQQAIVNLSKGVIIAAGARFMSGIKIGNHVMVGLNATIGHDSVLESYVSVMPGANVSGNVFLDEGVYIGAGAVVLQGTSENKLYLCKSLTVGAGAVVTNNIASGAVVVGIPARVIK